MATGRIGVTPTLGTRWSKAPSAGTTSLSGLDDSSVSLVYSVGYEQVYRNGVLLSRGNDYTATSGNSITLTDATVNGDIIEVFANELVPLTDAISKGQFTAKGSLLSASAASTPAVLAVGTNNQVLTADSSTSTGLKWATPSSGALALISRTTFSNVATQDFDSVFTSTYSSYTIILEQMGAATAADDLQIQFRAAGSTLASGYYGNAIECTFGGSTVTNNATSNGSALMITTYAGPSSENSAGFIEFTNVGDAALRPVINWHYYAMSDGRTAVGGGQGTTTGTTYTGFRLKSSSSNISGTVAIYGRVKA